MVALRGQASIEDDEPTRPDGGAAPGVTPLRSVGRPLGRWIDSLGRRGLRLGVSFKTGTTILSLGGRLDQHSAPLLKEGFHEIVALTPRAIDIDLSSVNRIDGIGLAALVWSWGLAHQRGRQLRLLHVPSATREIVSRMNLHHVLQVVEDGSFR
jgi:anti-anti-sigma factor